MRELKRNRVSESSRDGFDIVRGSKGTVRNLNDCVNNINKSLQQLKEDPSDSRQAEYIRNYCRLLIENAEDLEDFVSLSLTSESVGLNNNEKAWLGEILAVAQNLRHTDNLIDSLIKKSNRGVDLDRETLRNSSVIGSIIREAIAKYKKDYLIDDMDIKSEITTLVRNAIKDELTDYILEQVDG
jgi:hypothetical protein